MRAWELAERFGYSFGCGDTCIFGSRGGQHTNGGCRCLPRNISAANITDADLYDMRRQIRELAGLLQQIADKLPDSFTK